MSEWKKVKLGDIIEINKNSIGRSYKHKTIHYHDISSIGTGSIEGPSELLLVDAPSRAKRIVNDGDTVIATVRPGNKSYYHFTSTRINDIVSTGFAVLTAKADINHKFLYYLVTNDSFTKYLVSNERGATYPAVSASDFNRALIQLPPLPTQKKIAKILSNYDDLIENNLKRIKLLEESARLTYEEWFLRFRIDGEKLEIDNETELPIGWSKVKIGEVVDLKQGFALNKKSDHYISDKGLPLLKISDLLRETESLFVKKTIPKQFLVDENEIIYTRTAQVGYVFMGRKGVVYNNCFKVIPKDEVYIRFVYQFLSLKSIRNFARSLATGAAQADLNHAAFKSIDINYPTIDIINRFNPIIEPFFISIKNLKNQNKLLKEARDILLPRLITCMIDVEELEVAA